MSRTPSLALSLRVVVLYKLFKVAISSVPVQDKVQFSQQRSICLFVRVQAPTLAHPSSVGKVVYLCRHQQPSLERTGRLEEGREQEVEIDEIRTCHKAIQETELVQLVRTGHQRECEPLAWGNQVTHQIKQTFILW